MSIRYSTRRACPERSPRGGVIPIVDPSQGALGKDKGEWHTPIVDALGDTLAVKAPSWHQSDVPAGKKSVDLVQRLDPSVDGSVSKALRSEKHKDYMPGYVKLSTGRRDPDEMVVTFIHRTRLPAIKVGAGFAGSGDIGRIGIIGYV